jgi:hypothetical protein
MRAAVQLAGALLLALGPACASDVAVRVEQRGDLAGVCTWNFLPAGSKFVRTPHADPEALDAWLARQIERGLLERGFARVAEDPDVLVTYALEVRRTVATVTETPAVEHLSSLHNTPSYDIQASEQRTEVREAGRLSILVSDPSAAMVLWHGRIEGRYRGSLAARVEASVDQLLDRLPPPAHGRAQACAPATAKPLAPRARADRAPRG